MKLGFSTRAALALAGFLGPLAVASFLGTSAARARAEDGGGPVKPGAPAGYATRDVRGWTVRVNEGFLKHNPELAERVLSLLDNQLYQVGRRVPAPALRKLRTVIIWVEENEPNTKCMAYHPNVDWLKEHGVLPDKAKCVEIANARNFLKWTIEQPWMVLHELAHAYHDQFLPSGFGNAEVKAAFDHAVKAGIYGKVQRINGRDEAAYAKTNPMEYFAESSEAFFGTNDFYPFVRSELERYDPTIYRLLADLWGRDGARGPSQKGRQVP